MTSKIKNYLLELRTGYISQLRKKEIQGIPEILAFNFMMALIPMLIILFQILAYLSIETRRLDEVISHYLPTELYTFLMEFLQTARINLSDHPVLLIITFCTLLLTISKGINGIFKSFFITYHVESCVPGYKHRLAAILVFFLLLFFGAFAIFFITTSHRLLGAFSPFIQTVIDLGIFIIMCFAFFYLLFRLAPNKNKSFKELLPGLSVTTVGFVITTSAFTFYVDQLANFHLVYGSLAIIIILLTWLYLIAWVLNVGIQTNYIVSGEKEN